jgi:hypothetical protein
MSRGASGLRRTRATVLGLSALSALAVLAAGGGWLARRRADKPGTVAAPIAASPTSGASGASGASVAAPPSADPTWCGKPLGEGAVGRLVDRAACAKISLTGTAPGCVFWADCGELHFEVDCTKPGPGQCRCDGDEGRTVAYDPAFCTLDRTQAGAGLRAILDSAATACRWAPR